MLVCVCVSVHVCVCVCVCRLAIVNLPENTLVKIDGQMGCVIT